MTAIDHPRIAHALVMAHTFTETNKALLLQVRTEFGGAANTTSMSYSEVYAGSWAFVAVPMPPDLDAEGNVSGACEALVAEEGDDLTILGQRDVRWSKFAQDFKKGESGIINAYGSRIKLGKDSVSLAAGGGFLNFDIKNKTVGLVGIPTTGGSAPSLSISTTAIGMTSATGAASLVVQGNQVTISGAAAALDVGSVALGKGAVDPVVTVSTLQPILTALYTFLVTFCAAQTSPGTPPPVIAVARGSMRVKAVP